MDVLELFEQHFKLVREYPSYLEYNCPFCYKEGLKIKRLDGSYDLYKCTCNVKRIFPYLRELSNLPYVPKLKQVPKVIESVPNLSNLKLSIITNPPLLTDLSNKYQDLDGVVIYQYSTNQRTRRINRCKSDGKKRVIPQTPKSGGWVNGIGESTFPVFTNRRILLGELVVVAEGEKCVEYLNYKSIEAMSLLGSYSTSITKIQEVLELSRSLVPNVVQFLYLPDLDAKGMQKADIFQKAIWEMKLPCKIFDLRGELVKSTNFVQGYDIADYITENKDVNLVEVFENEFRES